MLGAHHFTDSEQPPQLWPERLQGAIKMNCGEIVLNAVPGDWVLVNESHICKKCKARSKRIREYWTFWQTGQKRFDPES